VPLPAWLRRVHRHFGISAPRMAVRTRLSWRWRAVVVATLALVVGGMWWWGFDFGQILGGLNRKEMAEKLLSLEAETARLRTEGAQLRARSSRLETELAMRDGAQATLSKHATELQNENSQLKEELVFLQRLVADSNKQVGLSIQRLESFHATIRSRGLEPLAYAVGDAAWSCESGYRAMIELLEREPAPTAVFASNDRLAIGAVRAAVEGGLHVPHDISIVGVDNIDLAPYQTPPLTTIRQSLTDVATLATKILLELVAGRQPHATQVVFEPELIVRQSTAPPPEEKRSTQKEVTRRRNT